MKARVPLLLAAIGLAILIGVVGWIVRYQPFGPARPMGTLLASNVAAASGWIHHAAMASDGRNLHLVGGYVASGQPTAAVRIFDPSTKTWREGPALPEARAAGAPAFDGARLPDRR